MKNIKRLNLQKILNKKECSFCEFFNIEEPPKDDSIAKLTWELDNSIGLIKDYSKDLKENTKLDCNHLAKDNAEDILQELYGKSNMLEKIEDFEISYNQAYNELKTLLKVIVENEDINLSNYTSLNDTEIKAIKRKYRIDSLLNE